MRSGTPPTPKLGKTWKKCRLKREEAALLSTGAKTAMFVAVRLQPSFFDREAILASEFTSKKLRSNAPLYVSRDKFAKKFAFE
jgi:hypothetical protein